MPRQVATVLSLFDMTQKFPDEQSAIDYLSEILWKDGVVCGYCKSKNVKERISKPNFYHCNDCKKDFSIRVGTIFHRSHVPLYKWLWAMYMMVTARKGVSSLQFSEPKIQFYVNESVFRLNEGNCKYDTVDRLESLVRGVAGKRLTYRMLVHGI